MLLEYNYEVLGWRMTEKKGSLKARAIALLFLMSIGFVLAAFLPFGAAQSEVTGAISADTRWTKANSPYVLSGPLFINAGVSLLIDSGVTINFNQHIIQVNGVLYASGSASDPIMLNNGKIVFTSTSGAWNEETATGSLIKNAVFTSCKIETQDASPKIANNAFKRGSITVVGVNPHVSGSAPIIVDNNIVGTTSLGSGISIAGNNRATITGNVIAGWSDGILAGNAQYASDSYPKIERNLIVNNTHGIRIDISIKDSWGNSYPAIQGNTISQNLAGIRVTCIWEKSGNPDEFLVPAAIRNNNIYDNSDSNAVGDCILDVNNNWWGTTSTEQISQKVSSRYMFAPFLMTSYASAPSRDYNPNPRLSSAIPVSTTAPTQAAQSTQPTNPQSTPSFIPQPVDVQSNQDPKFPIVGVVAVVVAVVAVVLVVIVVMKLYRKGK